MYASSWRLNIEAISNIVRTVTEAASPSGEGQSMHGPCENIFGYPHRQICAPPHEAPVAEGQAREAVNYFYMTLLSN